ncbi:ankyrin repeat domain-containing protein [Cellulomonas sp. NPDC057328]|uniref:ankyrin repeat domain-containing protein n=1 Tax=Cellulomonas sp. NPDC057328 TaxID=3346101 RepID=UPI003639A3BC
MGVVAPARALQVLRALASFGDTRAALTLAGVVADELGLDATAYSVAVSGTAPAALATLDAPTLPLLAAAVHHPLSMTRDMARWRERAQADWLDDCWPRVRSLIERDAATSDDVLRAIVACGVLRGLGTLQVVGVEPGPRHAIHLLELAAGGRVVPGTKANDQFEFGRDLMVGLTRARDFEFRVYHEVGHHLQGFSPAVADGTVDQAALVRSFARDFPRLLASYARTHPAPARASGPVLATSLSVHGTRDGMYLVASFSTPRFLLAPQDAAALALTATRLMDVDPGRCTYATSGRGTTYIGVAFEALEAAVVARRAERVDRVVDEISSGARPWLAAATADGRVVGTAYDLTRALGLSSAPTVVSGDGTVGEGWDWHRDPLSGEDLGGAPDERLRDLLAVAVRRAAPDAVTRLLKAGARGPVPLGELGSDVAVAWDRGPVTAFVPTPASMTATVRALALAGVDVDHPLDGGSTLLTDSARRSARLATSLLDAGVHPDAPDARGATALCEARDLETAQALLDAGADPDAVDGEGRGPLHHALRRRIDGLPRVLIERGASATRVDHQGVTPLHLVSTPAAVDLVVAAGGDVGAATTTGETALMGAAITGDAGVLRSLLALGADVHTMNARGATALHYAAQSPPNSSRAVLSVLLDAGAEVDEEDDAGETPLMCAALVGNAVAVEALLAAGADPKATTTAGETALVAAHMAAQERSRFGLPLNEAQQCVTLLLDAGATRDDEGGGT